MKLQCDVCSADEAAVYCTADEAALCSACDHRVHHANKLASKHRRFSLLYPSSKDSPICDICQEKRAFLFCQQDRAILCRDCDGSIHEVNELTKKHNRFLLTGVKLSPSSSVYLPAEAAAASSSSGAGDCVPSNTDQKSKKQALPISTPNSNSSDKPLVANSNSTMNNKGGGADRNPVISEDPASSTIAEYLMETLPGWRVEDFLDFPSTPFGFYKVDEEISPLFGTDIINPLASENMGLWVPQAPMVVNPSVQMGLKETKENSNMKNNSRRWTDDAFTVPQMSPPSKKVRYLW